MRDEILDKLNEDNGDLRLMTLIGIGMFLWLSIVGCGALIRILLEDIMINYNVDVRVNIWISQIFTILAITIGTIIAVKKLKSLQLKNNFRAKKILRILIIVFVISQLIQFFYTFNEYNIWPDYYLDNLEKYYLELQDYPILKIIKSGFEMLKYVIVGFVILKK